MKLYHQIGWGMMALSQDIQEQCGTTTVVLSPRDLTPEQLMNFGYRINSLEGNTLLDPQFYLPRSDHERLISHSYWPENYETEGFNEHGRINMMTRLAEKNQEIGTRKFIVPGERATEVNDLWLDSQKRFYESANNITNQPLIMTICLSSDAVKSYDQINSIMEMAEKYKPAGFYLVLEHPSNQYIVNDPIWLTNSLDLAAGLSLLESEVIVGYSNHQQLIMACAGVTGIASGTYKNVRMFPIDKFKADDEDDINQRAIWYYCPQALSEFKLPFIEVAITRFGLNPDLLKPDFPSPYSQSLFDAPRPTISGWKEGMSFKHYLAALSSQCINIYRDSYDNTFNTVVTMINKAEELLNSFRQNGLRGGGDRNFMVGIEATRTALEALDQIHGPRLRRRWNYLRRE